ncbi:MAG: hypothetical protein WBL45_02340 [Solirubrobacterales bacterium]
MAATREIAIGGLIELREPVEGAPAGARGGIIDVLDSDRVMVELTSLPPEPILDRIVVVPVGKLRLIEPARRH